MNIKRIHNLQQKKGSEKKAETDNFSKKKKNISINSVITRAKKKEPRAGRHVFPHSEKIQFNQETISLQRKCSLLPHFYRSSVSH